MTWNEYKPNAICQACGKWFHDPNRPFRRWQIKRFCPGCAIDAILQESSREVSEFFERYDRLKGGY